MLSSAKTARVLILIVLEDALGEEISNLIFNSFPVLILIVLEDALGVIRMLPSGSNPRS